MQRLLPNHSQPSAEKIRRFGVRILRCMLVLFVLSAMVLPHAIAADSSSSLDAFGPTKDGADMAASLFAAVKKWSDYRCESELWIYKPDKVTKSGCKFFYKNNSVRVQVTGGGFRDGTILVKQKDGSVKAKGGTLLGFMTMNLDPDSRMLILPNGTNVTKSDLPTLFQDIESQLAAGGKSRVTSSPVEAQDMPEKTYVWEQYAPGGQVTVRRLFLGADAKLPLRIDLFKDGKRVSSAWLHNLAPNVGLSDDLFKL